MQRNVRIAGLWKGQWNTQESIHSIRKWTPSHICIHAHCPMQESSVHTWTPGSSRVSRVSPLNCETESISSSVLSDSLGPHGLQPTRLLCPWDSPGKNTGVGCYACLQRIFLTQRLNLCLLRWQIFYHWAIWEAPLNWDHSVILYFPSLFLFWRFYSYTGYS